MRVRVPNKRPNDIENVLSRCAFERKREQQCGGEYNRQHPGQSVGHRANDRAKHSIHRAGGAGGLNCHSRQCHGHLRVSAWATTSAAHQLLHCIAGHCRFAGGIVRHPICHPCIDWIAEESVCLPIYGVAARCAVYHIDILFGRRVHWPILGHIVSAGVFQKCADQNGYL